MLHRQTKATPRLEQVAAISLATHTETARGKLTVVQSAQDIPFSIARIFYIYDTPSGCERGAHAHRKTEQVFIAIAGSFSLDVTDSCRSETYAMNEPNCAVYVPAMIWARVYNFSKDAVCLVLASAPYDPADYIRDWNEYVSAVAKSSQ